MYRTTICVLLASSAQAVNLRSAAKVDAAGLPFDCYLDKGADYVGLKDFSMSGRECMNWITQGKESANTKGIGNHNYCRNPSGSKDKPWCYTVDPATKWEYCQVDKCAKEAAAPKAWVAPEGAKSKGSKPCEYKPADNDGYKKHEAGRSCMDNKGDKWWLITNKKNKAKDAKGCKTACSLLAGSEYFTVFSKADKEGNTCGCYRECVLVPKSETVNGPTAYRMDPLR